MNKKPTSSIITNLKKIIILLFIPLLGAGLCYHFTKSLSARSTASSTIQPSADLKQIGDNWWEATRLIYHGIPARIVFLLPPASLIHPDAVNKSVWQEFDRIGKIFNPFDPDSEIFQLNSSPHSEPIMISDDVNSVLHISKRLWIDTDGHFDPTMWPIKQLWQNAEKNQQIPAAKEIAAALQKTGFGEIRLDGKVDNSIHFLNQPVKFDFGGVVKGYAVDQVRQILLDFGITAGLVQLGGEISTFGNNDEEPWRIGVQHPKQMDKIWGVISSYSDIRVSTSGNYRQPLKINGQSFYHIFSPKTGMPVSEKILGVTTVSLDNKTTNARLDGIATAITVIGASEGLALATKSGIDVLILFEKKNGSIGELMTKGLSHNYSPYN